MSEGMNKIVCVKPITRNGNSLTVSITHEIQLMNLGRGDKVKVILERTDSGNGD